MWCTVVECLLQQDARNVIVAVDLANCFNDIDRDALVEELRRYPELRPLARYVVAAYPRDMVSVTRINADWRRLCTGTIPCRYWWPKGGPKSVSLQLRRTGQSAFVTCSTQIMRIKRAAPRAHVTHYV